MPGSDVVSFESLRARAHNSFDYLVRRSSEPDTSQAKQRQESITEAQFDEMLDILTTLYNVWQPLKDLPSNDPVRNTVFELIKLCYLRFCYAYLMKPSNEAAYLSGMQEMQTQFSPVLNNVMQVHFFPVPPPALAQPVDFSQVSSMLLSG